MNVIFGLRGIKRYKNPAVAIGVFDGVHLAHQQILKETIRIARRRKGVSMVLTFWPHPQQEGILYSLEHRLKLLAAIGIDVCIIIKFNRIFSRISAEDFIRNILVKRIHADYICVGRNFRFGSKLRGDLGVLRRLSRIYDFKLRIFKTIRINNRPISSTSIRKLIKRGEIDVAGELLSRPVSILGTVIRGTYRARTLGFPTANINPHHEITPPSGIYAVWVIFGNQRLGGICYIGRRPTFTPLHSKRPPQSKKCKTSSVEELQSLRHIEVHIFGFQKKIYGRYLEIEFVKKIRDERKFSSGLSLARQVRRDILLAQRIFSRH